jgi:hypothetical protein
VFVFRLIIELGKRMSETGLPLPSIRDCKAKSRIGDPRRPQLSFVRWRCHSAFHLGLQLWLRVLFVRAEVPTVSIGGISVDCQDWQGFLFVFHDFCPQTSIESTASPDVISFHNAPIGPVASQFTAYSVDDIECLAIKGQWKATTLFCAVCWILDRIIWSSGVLSKLDVVHQKANPPI